MIENVAAMVGKVVFFCSQAFFVVVCAPFYILQSLSYFETFHTDHQYHLYILAHWTSSSLLHNFWSKDSFLRLWLMELGFLACSDENIDIHVPPQQTSCGIAAIAVSWIYSISWVSSTSSTRAPMAAPDICWVEYVGPDTCWPDLLF